MYEFKYVLVAPDGSVEWESGSNRVINVSSDGRASLDDVEKLPHHVRHHLNRQLGTIEFIAQHTCSNQSHVVAVIGDAEVRLSTIASLFPTEHRTPHATHH